MDRPAWLAEVRGMAMLAHCQICGLGRDQTRPRVATSAKYIRSRNEKTSTKWLGPGIAVQKEGEKLDAENLLHGCDESRRVRRDGAGVQSGHKKKRENEVRL